MQWNPRVILAGTVAAALGALALGAAVRTAPPEELHERARDLQGEAERLHERGSHEDAQELLQRAERLMGQAREMEAGHRRLEEMHHRIRDLQQKGRHDEARNLMREAEALQERLHHAMQRDEGGERDERAERDQPNLEQRVHHMRQAAEHLQAAGMHEEARRLARHVEELIEESRARSPRRGDDELQAAVQELGQGYHQLRREIEEIHEVLGRLEERIEQVRRGR